ncbi:MAG TPA: hypothetical protein VL326_19515 [Kofleriaceae bacterium]|jgi:hypothetical protein|nr:hypothetical protein [Kofleriaceae bacterium]
MLPAKKPVDVLRSIAAPRELIEWVRKMPPEEAVRRAWIDVTRADWIPYLAILRGISKDSILRATCKCASEIAAPALAGTHQGERIAEILADPASLPAAETRLEDLRLAMLAHGDKPDAPAWTFWCQLALELARAVRRGNAMIGISLALRMIATAGGRRASSDLVARYRDELLMA